MRQANIKHNPSKYNMTFAFLGIISALMFIMMLPTETFAQAEDSTYNSSFDVWEGYADYGSWGGYGGCSRSCDTGTQSRNRSCIRTSDSLSIDCNFCGGSCIETQYCNTHPCFTYSWQTSAWGSCTGSGMGQGTQTRSVTCVRNDGQTALDTQCSGTKPANSGSCTLTAANRRVNVRCTTLAGGITTMSGCTNGSGLISGHPYQPSVRRYGQNVTYVQMDRNGRVTNSGNCQRSSYANTCAAQAASGSPCSGWNSSGRRPDRFCRRVANFSHDWARAVRSCSVSFVGSC